MRDFSSRFRKLLEQLVSEDARIVMPGGGGDLIILVTWRLTTDPSRPNKRSRMIRILISEEALEDYAAGSEGLRLASDARLRALLKARLQAFDPNHDAPRGVDPPPVTWIVSTLELNG